MAYTVMAYTVMAHIVIACGHVYAGQQHLHGCIVIAYIVMACGHVLLVSNTYIVMACIAGPYSYGLQACVCWSATPARLYSHGLHSYGPCRYGPRACVCWSAAPARPSSLPKQRETALQSAVPKRRMPLVYDACTGMRTDMARSHPCARYAVGDAG